MNLFNKITSMTLFISILSCFSSSTLSQSIIVNSLSKNLSSGQNIEDNEIVHLQKNEQIRVMNKVTGETKLIFGPFDGVISAYEINCKSVVGCKPVETPKHIGATRGLKKK